MYGCMGKCDLCVCAVHSCSVCVHCVLVLCMCHCPVLCVRGCVLWDRDVCVCDVYPCAVRCALVLSTLCAHTACVLCARSACMLCAGAVCVYCVIVLYVCAWVYYGLWGGAVCVCVHTHRL